MPDSTLSQGQRIGAGPSFPAPKTVTKFLGEAMYNRAGGGIFDRKRSSFSKQMLANFSVLIAKKKVYFRNETTEMVLFNQTSAEHHHHYIIINSASIVHHVLL